MGLRWGMRSELSVKNVTYALGYALRHVQHFGKEVCAGGYALTQEKQKQNKTKHKQKTPPDGGEN